MLRKIVMVVLFSFYLPVFAEIPRDVEYQSIPYMKAVYQPQASGENRSIELQMSAYGIPFTIDTVNLKPEDIKEIAAIGKRFCKHISDADVTLSFVMSRTGEIAIVEGTLQSGVEVTFHCK